MLYRWVWSDVLFRTIHIKGLITYYAPLFNQNRKIFIIQKDFNETIVKCFEKAKRQRDFSRDREKNNGGFLSGCTPTNKLIATDDMLTPLKTTKINYLQQQ